MKHKNEERISSTDVHYSHTYSQTTHYMYVQVHTSPKIVPIIGRWRRGTSAKRSSLRIVARSALKKACFLFCYLVRREKSLYTLFDRCYLYVFQSHRASTHFDASKNGISLDFWIFPPSFYPVSNYSCIAERPLAVVNLAVAAVSADLAMASCPPHISPL